MSALKKLPWFEIILIVVVMSVSAYAALSDAQNFSLRWFTRDDAYYYFKVAQNISEGHGSTFDGINLANGYHPLWMLVCIPIFALARFDLVLPLRILLIVMAGLQVSTAILLYRLLGKVFAPAIGALAALYWIFNFDILINLYMQGLESGIAAFFVVLLVYKLYQFETSWRQSDDQRKQLIHLGIIGALTILSRLDLVFLVALAGIWVVFRGHLLRYFLPLDILAAVVSVFLSFVIRLGLPEYYGYSNVALTMAGLGLAFKLLSIFAFGLYQRHILSDFRKTITLLFLSTIASSTILGVLMLLVSQTQHFAGFPRAVALMDFGFTLLFFGVTRIIYFFLHNRSDSDKVLSSPFAELTQKWKAWLQDGLAFFAVAFGALGGYMLSNKFTFGTFSPVSGQIKRWWGSFPARVYGGATRSPFEFFGVDYQGDGLAWTPITNTLGEWVAPLSNQTRELQSFYLYALTGLALLACLLLFLNKNKSRFAVSHLALIPLITGSFLQAIYYHSGGYSAYKEWYWVTQRVTSVLVLGIALGIGLTLMRKIKVRHVLAWVAVLYLGFNMWQTYWAGIRLTMQYDRWSDDVPMMEIATLLEANTEPGSLIGFTGGGNVGYFIQDRTILNMDGLINSHEYYLALREGRAGEFLDEIGLDYVLANPNILDHQPYDGQFDAYLQPTGVSYGGKQLLKYESPK